MKLLRLASVYPGYSNQFYAAHPDLPSKFYQDNAMRFSTTHSRGRIPGKPPCVQSATRSTKLSGIFGANAASMGKRESDTLVRCFRSEVDAVEQVRQFRAGILWFDDHDSELLRRIREGVPAISLVAGWTGRQSLATMPLLTGDVILSMLKRVRGTADKAWPFRCGTASWLRSENIVAIEAGERLPRCNFHRQLVRDSEFNIARESCWKTSVEALPIKIFSPLSRPTL